MEVKKSENTTLYMDQLDQETMIEFEINWEEIVTEKMNPFLNTKKILN